MYDIIGSREKAVAVIPDPELLPRVLKYHKNVKSVILKKGGRKGTERLYETEVIYGDRNTEVTHVEHGLKFRVDPSRVYFSPREAKERQDLAGTVKDGERILVMFSGIGCIGIAMAARKRCEVVGVEINPEAVRYAEENARINKLRGTVRNILGDVRDVCPRLGRFDRVVMPLPEDSLSYADLALGCVKPGGTVHVYLFSGSGEEAAERVKETFGPAAEVVRWKKVLPHSPKTWKYRVDVRIRGENP